MAKIPAALEGYQQSLLTAREHGQVSPRRQVTACAEQSRELVADDGYFAKVVADAKVDDAPLAGETRERLVGAARAAATAYAHMAGWLEQELLPHAPEADACGLERYRLESRYFLGATVDLEETYRWGQAEVASLHAQMSEIAEGLEPGASVRRGVEILDADDRYALHGTDALKAWMQERADEVIADLKDVHFDIPGPVQRIECMIAPTQTGGIYYTGPSDDFSRPGRMWWSVPKGNTAFRTWNELTTVYHEGVPGHHLQVAQTVYRSELLNRWRRLQARTSRHGEGWAPHPARGLGALRGAADGRARLHGRPRQPDGLACGTVPSSRPSRHRHRRALRFRRPGGGGRRRLGLRQGVDLPDPLRLHGREGAALRAQPLPRVAGAGAQLQDR